MVKAIIKNPLSDVSLKVGNEGEVGVVVHPHPPRGSGVSLIPFRQFLTVDGTSTGSNNMMVAGTLASPIDFYVGAKQGYDTYIKTIAVVIADANAALDKFGAITALTNGVEFFWENQALGKVVINPSMKSNFDFVQQALGLPSFGTGNDAFKANNVIGTSEAYIPVFDLVKIFDIPYGIKLESNSLDKLVMSIKDNTTAVDRFDMVAFGSQLMDLDLKEGAII